MSSNPTCPSCGSLMTSDVEEGFFHWICKRCTLKMRTGNWKKKTEKKKGETENGSRND